MFKNYLKIAWRNLLKTKLYSSINIFGLAVGIASFVLLLLYFNYELSYDKWDNSLSRVYKLGLQGQNGIEWEGNTPAPLGELLKNKYPNIEAATSLQNNGGYEALLSSNDKKIYQDGLISVDSLFFKVFPFQLSHGDVNTALNPPDAAIISEELSRKLFGNESPIAKTIKLYNAYDVQITGVLKNPDKPSTLHPQLLFRAGAEKSNYHWQNFSYETYVKLNTPKITAHLENDINRIYYNERIKKDSLSFENWEKQEVKTTLFAERFTDLHNFPKNGSSNFKTVAVLLILAVLLLLTGSINFSNLYVAASIRRAKEIGVRRVLGSNRKRLFWQFIIEAFILSLISFVIAVLLLLIIIPPFKKEFNIQLHLFDLENSKIYIQVFICMVIVTFLSGLYPAIFLSRYNAVKVLKGDYSQGKQGMGIRNALLITQFCLSGFFIFAIVAVKKQMYFMQTKDKGFSSEQVVRITISQNTGDNNFDLTRNKLLSIPGVKYVSKTTNVPGDAYADTSAQAYRFEGRDVRLITVKVSNDYFKTIGATIKAGRDFNGSIADENTRSIILNESAARLLNTVTPVGKFIGFPFCDTVQAQIVGIIKDFNVQNLSNAIRPVAYSINNKACSYMWGGAMLVKLSGNNVPRTIAAIENTWKQVEPDFPLRYSFLDDNFQKLYAGYIRVQKIVAFFTLIAVVIAAIGLFALTAFLLKERTKEIGIRKVLGADIADISLLVAKNFLTLIGIATAIALPLSWWAAQQWLQTFAYRIHLDWFTVISTMLIIAVIVLITIGTQAVKAAMSNPVKSLNNK
ncbi:ABC transporter permease [Niabella aquatica]